MINTFNVFYSGLALSHCPRCIAWRNSLPACQSIAPLRTLNGRSNCSRRSGILLEPHAAESRQHFGNVSQVAK